jgi:ABC-2 type transport system ATP-binding protein
MAATNRAPGISPVIETQGLTREFTRRSGRWLKGTRTTLRAVDDLTVTVEAGSAVGYIGANGAGKSTTIKMLIGILVPSSGMVRTCGLDPVRQRKQLAAKIGVVFGQRSALWWDLPLQESFTLLAAIHRLDPARARARREELIQRMDAGAFLTTPVRQLSLGQRMRGEIIAALLHEPELIVLDEPTVGLDVLSKEHLRQFLAAEVAEYGRSLLLTTHDMGDIERLCERVLVVDQGRLAFDGSIAGLIEEVGAQRVLVVDLASPADNPDGGSGTTYLGAEAGGLRHRFAFAPGEIGVAEVLSGISRTAEVRDLTVEEPDIEDVVRRLYAAQATPNPS